jgi:GDP-L-fucose synthase
MDTHAKIYIAGHRGLAGSAIHRRLRSLGYDNFLLRAHGELDLERQDEVETFFDVQRPDYVFLAAARVGGILANNPWPADFIYNNLLIPVSILRAAQQAGVKRLLFLGSSCIYPRQAPQPMKEEYLLTGELEPTNEPYAIAKIAGIKTCESFNRQYDTQFISVMPTNLYGPNDNFDLESSHVLPAMIRKFHEAKTSGADTVTLWGTGKPMREFLHVDDMADACVFVMNLPDDTVAAHFTNYPHPSFVNVGTGVDVTIRELAETIKETVGFTGDITWDTSKPDGTPRKLLDVSRLRDLGWEAKIPLRDGIRLAYRWFLDHADTIRR